MPATTSRGAGGLAARLGPLAVPGYMVALCWTGSPAAAERILLGVVERLAAADGPGSRLDAVYFGELLCALHEFEAAQPPSERDSGGPGECARLRDVLRSPGVLSRSALVLHLGGGLPAPEIARILGFPLPLIRAALHIGARQLDRAAGEDAA